MELWKLLLITLLAAVVLGCLIGVLVGKHQVKKQSGNYRPLLNLKERIIYGACILLGCGCIAFGVLYQSPGAAVESSAMMQGEIAQGAMPDEIMQGEMPAGGDMTALGESGQGAANELDEAVEGDADTGEAAAEENVVVATPNGGGTAVARPRGGMRRSGGNQVVVMG